MMGRRDDITQTMQLAPALRELIEMVEKIRLSEAYQSVADETRVVLDENADDLQRGSWRSAP